jgi:hypothetical protein
MTTEIDWSSFDRFSESTCFCRCGQTFRSHAKLVTAASKLTMRLVTRKPCPSCGKDDDCKRVEDDPEVWSISDA